MIFAAIVSCAQPGWRLRPGILQQILTGSGTDTEVVIPLIEIEDVRYRAVVGETDGLADSRCSVLGIYPSRT